MVEGGNFNQPFPGREKGKNLDSQEIVSLRRARAEKSLKEIRDKIKSLIQLNYSVLYEVTKAYDLILEDLQTQAMPKADAPPSHPSANR